MVLAVTSEWSMPWESRVFGNGTASSLSSAESSISVPLDVIGDGSIGEGSTDDEESTGDASGGPSGGGDGLGME